MQNWKWVNLSKMAGFNISLSLKERQSSTDKKHNKSLRLVLFMHTHKTMHFYLSVNVFSMEVLIGDTILTSPTGDGTPILRGHPSHAKV